MKYTNNNQSGQALTSLLVIMFLGLSIITSSVGVMNANISSTSGLEDANEAYYIAESGLEDALLRYIRNPNYTGGTLPINDGEAVISIASTNPVTFISQGTVGLHTRTIQVTISNNSGITTVTSWQEQ